MGLLEGRRRRERGNGCEPVEDPRSRRGEALPRRVDRPRAGARGGRGDWGGRGGRGGLDAPPTGASERWRGRLEEELARHYLIKERLLKVDDETINKVIRAVSEIGVEHLNTRTVIEA